MCLTILTLHKRSSFLHASPNRSKWIWAVGGWNWEGQETTKESKATADGIRDFCILRSTLYCCYCRTTWTKWNCCEQKTLGLGAKSGFILYLSRFSFFLVLSCVLIIAFLLMSSQGSNYPRLYWGAFAPNTVLHIIFFILRTWCWVNIHVTCGSFLDLKLRA